MAYDFTSGPGSAGSLLTPANMPTNQTSSAGSDWAGLFGNLLNTGATVAGSYFGSQQKPAAPVVPAGATTSNGKLYLIIGAVVVALLAGFLLLRRK